LPESPLGDCFRQNTKLLIGSKCFSLKSDNFEREGEEKRAAFIKYVAAKCGAEVSFDL